MAFVVRTYEQILEDMIAHVQTNSPVHDFNTGSVILTILESAALEDDEQYFQMAQLLEAFSILSATGPLLDERLADYDIYRLQATNSTGFVRFFDSNLITDQLAVNEAIGGTSLSLFSTADFPTTYPYTVRVGEGSADVQDVEVSSNDIGMGVLTLSTPLVAPAHAGYRVSVVSAGVKYVAVGTSVQVPPTVATTAQNYVLEENASILPGNFYSNSVRVRSVNTGAATNASGDRISRFTGSPPFPGAGVTGVGVISGGRDVETDSSFRQRGLQQIQSLSKGTPLALQSAVVGVEDPNTRQRVISANIIEDYLNDEVRVYIDDGSGLVPDIVRYGTHVLQIPANSGDTSLQFDTTDPFPSSGWLLIEEDGVNDAELVQYSAKTSTSLQLSTPLQTAHTASSPVSLVDVLTDSAENGQRYFCCNNPPVVRNSDRLFITDGTSFRLLSPGVDYVLSLGNGTIQLRPTVNLFAGDQVVINYSYYTNLISEAQKVIEGTLPTPELYPGYRAAGMRVTVEAPTIRRVTVRLALRASQGFREQDLAPQVRANIENYIFSLGVGGDVIRSKIIDVAHNVTGVYDVILQEPTGNIVILENERAIPTSATGSSLVQVY